MCFDEVKLFWAITFASVKYISVLVVLVISIPSCLIFTKGECRGEMETNKKIIRNLLLKNFNKNQIADISGLPEDVVNEIIQDIKNETK